MVKILVTRLSGCDDIPIPSQATANSAGVDLCAAIDRSVVLQPGRLVLVPTGFRVEIPEGFEWQIRPRSGLALKHGVTVLNSPGTIDSDYRGPVGVVLINHGEEPFVIRRGDRVAQAVLVAVETAQLTVVEELSPSERGEGGFGHTGI